MMNKIFYEKCYPSLTIKQKILIFFKKGVYKPVFLCYNNIAVRKTATEYRGVEQSGSSSGS